MANDQSVRGSVQDATEEGFAKLLTVANKAHREGLVLMGIVNIGTDKIGGVFVRVGQAQHNNAVLLGD
jgi:hypothetical protein